jgi:cell division septal protein FtsQ
MKRNKNRIHLPKTSIRFNKGLIASIAILTVCLAVMIPSFNCLKKMDCFKVKEVYTRYADRCSIEDSEEFCYLKGKNIFKIDLIKEAANISRFYPTYKKIRLTRYLPDKIVIDLLKRQPLAAIKASRPFFVDEHLVLFQLPTQEKNAALPLICGLEKKLNGAGYGTRLAYPELKLALDIIKKAKANSGLKDYAIARVEVADPGDTSVFMLVQKGLLDYTNVNPQNAAAMIEVKLGQEDIFRKISLLATLLKQVKNNLAGIKYIDLRFNEPVIKFKKPLEAS